MDASFVRDLIEAPVPNYPEEAARKSWSGIGVFEIRFRPDGTVEKVIINLTTGHQLLDNTARASIMRWRCKPGAQPDASITISFTTGVGLVEVKPDDDTGSEKRRNMLRADRPLYPYVARREGWGGYGVFVIRFASDGSATNVVTLKSTGHLILDNEAMATFRQWRCRPGVYTTVVVPINFTVPARTRPGQT